MALPHPDPPAAKPFAQFLREQRRGRLHDELTDELIALVAGVMKHGKQGHLTVKFVVKPEGDEAVTIADSYVTKIPTPPAKASIFFADEQGHISRQRLNQMEMALTGLDGGHADNDPGTAAEATS